MEFTVSHMDTLLRSNDPLRAELKRKGRRCKLYREAKVCDSQLNILIKCSKNENYVHDKITVSVNH